MLHLILYIVFSSVFTLTIKWVYNRGTEDILTIGAINYIVALVGIAPWLWLDGGQTGDPYAILTGGLMGLVYFIAFFFVIYSVKLVGASATTVVSVLSITMPITVAAFVWDAKPTVIQIGGIALALLSLCLIGIKPKTQGTNEPANEKEPKTAAPRTSAKFSAFILLSFFLLCGCSRICQEAFKHLAAIDQKPTYLLSAFLVAALPSVGMLLYRKQKIKTMELAAGTVMGISNGVQTFFILRSLDFFEGYIVFTVTSAGGIIFTMLVATRLLGEKLSKLTYIGIAIAVVALCLLNWNTSG